MFEHSKFYIEILTRMKTCGYEDFMRYWTIFEFLWKLDVRPERKEDI